MQWAEKNKLFLHTTINSPPCPLHSYIIPRISRITPLALVSFFILSVNPDLLINAKYFFLSGCSSQNQQFPKAHDKGHIHFAIHPFVLAKRISKINIIQERDISCNTHLHIVLIKFCLKLRMDP